MTDLNKLKAELATDPAHLGYATPLAATNWPGVAALGNALTGAGAATVTMTGISKNQFLKFTLPAAIRLSTGIGADGATPLTAAVIAKWKPVLAQAIAADPGSLIDLTLVESAALGSPVTDNLMTAAEYAALTTRTGSRFEVLGIVGPITDTQALVSGDDVCRTRTM